MFARNAHYALEELAASQYDVIQLDWGMDPAEARKRVGPNITLQVSEMLIRGIVLTRAGQPRPHGAVRERRDDRSRDQGDG